MAEIEMKKERNQTEILFAIRLNWLKWLSKPIQLVWFVIVQAALAAWRLITISVTALKGCYSRLLLTRSAIGGSVFFALILLGFYFAELTSAIAFIPIMLAISVLPLAWTIGEAVSVAKVRFDGNSDPKANAVPLGNGMTVARNMALYVVIIVAALVGQALISMLMSIPKIGPVLMGVILIPNVLLSIILLMACILLVFGIIVLPSYFLMEKKSDEKKVFKRFLHINVSLLSTLRSHSYWIQLLIIIPFAVLFSIIVAIPIMVLMGAGTGISVAVMGAVTSFSNTAQESLMALTQVTSGSFGLYMFSTSAKIGMFFIILAFSIVMGVGASPMLGGLASIYHNLYRRRTEGKTWTFIVLISLLAGLGYILFPIIINFF